MRLLNLKLRLNPEFYNTLEEERIDQLRPCQSKAIENGLLENKNLLICTPTASGKTLCAELAIINNILINGGKAIYLVPLKALAVEKFKEFKRRYEKLGLKIGLSIGNLDEKGSRTSNFDVIVSVAEKLDSLLRHKVSWLSDVKTVIIDEIHLLNDPKRGPTLEVIITLLKTLIKPQLIGLSATIGNPEELAEWLEAKLVIDNWRPVELKQGICCEERIEFY